jgi:DNA-binding transcriptional ArsR family regulator
VLSALAAPERLRIIRLLAERDRNVTQIIAGAEIPALNVSHHLTVLKHARLVQARKRGRFVIYSISPKVLAEIVDAGVPKDALDLGCCQLVLPGDAKTTRTNPKPPSNRDIDRPFRIGASTPSASTPRCKG